MHNAELTKLKAEISTNLKLKVEKFTLVGSVEGDLVIIERHDPEVRGDVYSRKLKKVVCAGTYIPQVISDSLCVNSGFVAPACAQGIDIPKFPVDTCVIQQGFEGVVLRLWCDRTSDPEKEIIRLSTYRNLSADNSRWVIGDSFGRMYDELGGDRTIFSHPDMQQYKDAVLYFLVAHPKLQVSSRFDIGNGFVSFLRSSIPLPDSIVADLESRFPHRGIISLERANEILNTTKPIYNSNADYVLISTKDGSHNIRVNSTAYDWRIKTRLENPNIAFTFYKLVTHSYVSGKYAKKTGDFLKLYPALQPVDIGELEAMVNNGDDLVFQPGDEKAMDSSNARLLNIVQILLAASAKCVRKEFFAVYRSYFDDKELVSNWLFKLWSDNHGTPDVKVNTNKRSKNYTQTLARINNIIGQAHEFAWKHERSDAPLEMLVARNIRDLISKEYGDSLYNIVMLVKNSMALAAEPIPTQ